MIRMVANKFPALVDEDLEGIDHASTSCLNIWVSELIRCFQSNASVCLPVSRLSPKIPWISETPASLIEERILKNVVRAQRNVILERDLCKRTKYFVKADSSV